jgi:hypothetical protein
MGSPYLLLTRLGMRMDVHPTRRRRRRAPGAASSTATRVAGRGRVQSRAATRVRRPGSPSRNHCSREPHGDRTGPPHKLSVMPTLHSDRPRTRARSSRVPNCFERVVDDLPTCAAFVATRPSQRKVGLDALSGGPRGRLEIGVRWSPDRGARADVQRAELRIVAAPHDLRAAVDAITEMTAERSSGDLHR